MAVSREALFEQVWAEPMLKVAARHGVSSNFLARVCERLNVPHPWQQLEVGKADPSPPFLLFVPVTSWSGRAVRSLRAGTPRWGECARAVRAVGSA